MTINLLAGMDMEWTDEGGVHKMIALVELI
jgi:hypothetical protein